MDRFDEIIDTHERLREIVGEPSDLAAGKVIDHIDDICKRLIAASPFAVMATKGADGLLDISPKGDPSGFVHVFDNKTLVVPDRPGNKRLDTFENLLTNPEIGLIFLIPGYDFTLRVSGRGHIVRDQALQARLAVNGKSPELLVVVTVEEAFMHCAKAMARSRIWKSDGWPDIADVPTMAEAMVAHCVQPSTNDEMQSMIDDDFNKNMY